MHLDGPVVKRTRCYRRACAQIGLLLLSAALCGAQVSGGASSAIAPLSCTTSAVPRNLRSGGLTEMIGDILLTCTGGSPLAPGTPIPVANITISLDTSVTNRIQGPGNVSEAVLLIDEPGSGLLPVVPGFGPDAPQIPCLAGDAPAVGAGPGGCTEYVGAGPIPIAVFAPGAARPGPNMFFGTVSANQVTFNGVPILPPAGTTRVFRITNIRANASGLAAGASGAQPVLASVAISPNSSLPLSNPVLTAGFVRPGLLATVRTADNTAPLQGAGAALAQCSSATMSPVAVLQFSEQFATGFKTRVQPTSVTNGQAIVPQNVPGRMYDSESGFVTFGVSANGGTVPIGLADYGTRLKAQFAGVPAGVHLYVSVANLVGDTASATASPPPPQAGAIAFAQLLSGEASPDGDGTVPGVSPTASLDGSAGTLQLAEIPLVGGSGTAVWEVIDANASALDTLWFGLWISYSAGPAAGSPPPGAATVNLSYAPTPGPLTFTGILASSASPTLPLLRFETSQTADALFAIGVCQTSLLFPYVTNQAGFDTGLVIANTSLDPFETPPQSGSCVLNWYGGRSRLPTTTRSIPAGAVYADAVSNLAPDGFTGYVIARCAFQFAHGFAAIGDVGLRNLAVEYLALVIGTNLQGARSPAPESLLH